MYGNVGQNRAVAIASRRRHDDAHNVPDSLGEDLNLGEDATHPQRGKQAKKDDEKAEAPPTEPPTVAHPPLAEAAVQAGPPSVPGATVQTGLPSLLSSSSSSSAAVTAAGLLTSSGL